MRSKVLMTVSINIPAAHPAWARSIVMAQLSGPVLEQLDAVLAGALGIDIGDDENPTAAGHEESGGGPKALATAGYYATFAVIPYVSPRWLLVQVGRSVVV